MKKFPVLMYHRVVSERCPVPGDDREEARYAVSLSDFTWQLDRLSRHGRTGVSMERIAERLGQGGEIPREWVGVTFDDGNESDYVHALPLLAERGFTATFFVCGNRVDADGGLARSMIRELAFAGQHVGAHGMTHRFLSTLDGAEEEREIAGSQSLLRDIVDRPVDHFAPPGGRMNDRTVVTLRRLSFRAVCTSRLGMNARRGSRFLYRRIPVTAATSRAGFDAIAAGKTLGLVPLYVRARGLELARRVLGENGYRRLRRRALRR